MKISDRCSLRCTPHLLATFKIFISHCTVSVFILESSSITEQNSSSSTSGKSKKKKKKKKKKSNSKAKKSQEGITTEGLGNGDEDIEDEAKEPQVRIWITIDNNWDCTIYIK